MMNQSIIWLSLISSAIILTIMYLRHGARDLLTVIGGFYFFFAFGPVINFLAGNRIYFGTIQDRISDAAPIFFLGFVGLFVASLVIKPRSFPDGNQPDEEDSGYFALNFILLLLILYTLFVLITIGPRVVNLGKIEKIQILNSTLHTNYLLIQFYVASFFFIAKVKKGTFQLYLINIALYILYNLLFNERDFLFLGVSIAAHYHMIKSFQRPSFIRTTFALNVLGVLSIIIGTTLFVLRSRNSFSFETALNQGSILFINTRIIEWTETFQPFLHGWTYLNSIQNLLPNFVYETDFHLLSWFKDLYAPASISGYGFALDAEAYLNFGYLGVPVAFFIIALVLRLISNKIGKHPIYLYLSVFYLAFLMSALRNDSLALFKATVYAPVFFGLVAYASAPINRINRMRNRDGILLNPAIVSYRRWE